MQNFGSVDRNSTWVTVPCEVGGRCSDLRREQSSSCLPAATRMACLYRTDPSFEGELYSTTQTASRKSHPRPISKVMLKNCRSLDRAPQLQLRKKRESYLSTLVHHYAQWAWSRLAALQRSCSIGAAADCISGPKPTSIGLSRCCSRSPVSRHSPQARKLRSGQLPLRRTLLPFDFRR